MGRKRTDPYASPDKRFASKVSVGTDGCWNWTGNRSPKGYGNFYADRERGVIRAHRWAYERFVGPIPDSLVIDHLCRNASCVNPAHLEPVTVRENTMRGLGTSALNARKTACIRGHEFTPENTRSDSKGARECVTCARARDREFNKRRRAS